MSSNNLDAYMGADAVLQALISTFEETDQEIDKDDVLEVLHGVKHYNDGRIAALFGGEGEQNN